MVRAGAQPAPDPTIDFAAAVRAATKLAPTGPAVTPQQAADAVAALLRFSRESELTVRDTAALGEGLPVAEAVVVDRPGWIAATSQGMAELTAPLTARLADKATPRSRAMAGRQLGVVLGFLSGKVLGQFDPLTSGPDGQDGQLLLVAPNIIKVERELRLDPADFRRWVCLHESTHRLQFTAVPWLRDYFVAQTAEFGAVADVDSREVLGRMVRAIRAGSGRRGADSSTAETGKLSWVEAMQTPEQRAIFDRMMALMSLLEGHADYVMDAVGPAVVPSVAGIRKAFSERRRKGSGPIDRMLRSLLGMDMKLSQYVKGEKFVSHVVKAVGMQRFNTVWDSPETLPTRAEIADPADWLRRVG